MNNKTKIKGEITAAKRWCGHSFGAFDTVVAVVEGGNVAKCIICGEEFEVVDPNVANLPDEEIINMIRNGRRRDFIDTIKAFYHHIPYSDAKILVDRLLDIDKDIDDADIARIFKDMWKRAKSDREAGYNN